MTCFAWSSTPHFLHKNHLHYSISLPPSGGSITQTTKVTQKHKEELMNQTSFLWQDAGVTHLVRCQYMLAMRRHGAILEVDSATVNLVWGAPPAATVYQGTGALERRAANLVGAP